MLTLLEILKGSQGFTPSQSILALPTCIINHCSCRFVINKKETHQESKTFIKGNKIVVANSPWGKFGLTICYDIRFPLLYRKLVKLGCKFVLVPAAFTVPTGKAHWKILLQSRAIENACYIIAAAQCGNHHGSRKTYGHSSIIDPWGKIILEASTKPGIFSKTLDLELINSVRLKIPSIYINQTILINNNFFILSC